MKCPKEHAQAKRIRFAARALREHRDLDTRNVAGSAENIATWAMENAETGYYGCRGGGLLSDIRRARSLLAAARRFAKHGPPQRRRHWSR